MPFDYLKDITQHTHGLGIIELIKITGTDSETVIEAMAEDRSVILQAKTHDPIAAFIGQFGMPNLTKLNIILGIPEYQKEAKINITTAVKNEVTVPTGLHFENKNGDFKNDYRFMSAELINEQLKQIKFKGAKWNVTFAPQVQNIQRFKFMASANSEETTFVAKTENNQLKFFFGDHSSHAGNFVFADNVGGTIAKGYSWPIGSIQKILELQGDKTCNFSDEGVAMITVDSGLAVYNYLIPAQQK
jgi:hypothetical protein